MANNKRPLFDINQGQPIVPGTPQLDPYGNPRGNPLDPVIPASPIEQLKVARAYADPIPILPPRHLSAPEGARTINLMSGQVVGVGATVTLFVFPAIEGATTVFYKYSLVSPAVVGADISWVPSINNRRVLQYHGDPATDYTLDEPTSADFSELGLSECQIFMQTTQYLTWTAFNGTGAPLFMGVRMVGYTDMSQRQVSSKFGD